MSVSTDNTCGGSNVKIVMRNPSSGTFCETSPSLEFDKGSTEEWQGSRLGTCETFALSDIILVRVQTEANDRFCPETVTIYSNDGKEFASTMQDEYSKFDTNHIDHSLVEREVSVTGILHA